MTTQMVVRIDPKLKTKVSALAKAEGRRVGEVVRKLLEDYVRDRDIRAYVNDLWTRIGQNFISRGLTPKDIPRIVKQVRAKK